MSSSYVRMKALGKATILALVNIAIRAALGIVAGCGLAAFAGAMYGGLRRLVQGGPGPNPIDAGLEVAVSWFPVGWWLGFSLAVGWSVVVLGIHVLAALRNAALKQS